MSLIAEHELDQILNIRIIRLASKMSLIFQRETLRPAGIKVQQWRILVSLALNGELHLRALARHSSQDPAHTSRVAKTMISQGWISRRQDGRDLRRVHFALTDEGEALVKAHWPKAKAFAADVKTLFNDDEFEQFKEMIARVTVACDERLNSSVDDDNGA